MRRFARWTNLSETTFVLAADHDRRRLPRAHLHAGDRAAVRRAPDARDVPRLAGRRRRAAAADDVIVQECAAGLVPHPPHRRRAGLRRPALLRSGPVDDELVDARSPSAFGLDRRRRPGRRVGRQRARAGWPCCSLVGRRRARRPSPAFVDPCVGLVGLHPPGSPHAIEVRAFFPDGGVLAEDPVTGSLNASLAQWLLGSRRLAAPYVASQGTALGRAGRVHVSGRRRRHVWVGGGTVTCIEGDRV